MKRLRYINIKQLLMIQQKTKARKLEIRINKSYKSFSIYKYLALIYVIWITTYKSLYNDSNHL